MKTNNNRNTDVIIIGAGPTGLMAACQLARYEIDFIIVDQKAGPTVESRAITVTARSLEIYQQMGIAAKAVEQGQPIKEFSLFMDGKERASFSIGEMGKGLTDFPYLLGFEQSKNETLLYETLQKYNRQVEWNTAFLDLEQNNEDVIVRLKNPQGCMHAVKAKYLIACDGASSPVRHALNCNFRGGTYENKFYVADTQLNWDFSYNRLLLSPEKKSFCAFFPMPGDNAYRVIGTLPKEFYTKEHITFSDVQDVIKDNVKFPLEFRKVNWFSIYKLHHRCVDNFRAGRCFLAGDAAHIHSPAGGQGMNTGLQDAYNLTWKLAMVLKGFANDKLLETYHTERYPFAKWLLNFTDRAFGFMTSDHFLIDFFRKYFASQLIKLALGNKKLRTGIFRTLSQIWYSYIESPLSLNLSRQALKFKAGERLPYIKININNKEQSIYCLLTAAKFHLLVIGKNNLPPELMGAMTQFEKIINIIFLPSEKRWKKLGAEKELYILVRPDNYIGLLSDKISEEILKTYFNKMSGI